MQKKCFLKENEQNVKIISFDCTALAAAAADIMYL